MTLEQAAVQFAGPAAAVAPVAVATGLWIRSKLPTLLRKTLEVEVDDKILDHETRYIHTHRRRTDATAPKAQ